MEAYRTNDLNQAAFLVLQGHMFQAISRMHKNSKRAQFTFLAGGNLPELVDLFSRRAAQVEPGAYAQALSDTRGAMYEALNGSNGSTC